MRRKHWHKTNPLPALIAAPLLVGLAFLMGAFVSLSHESPLPAAAAFPPVLLLPPSALTAKAAVLYDPQNHRILYAKNPAEQLPLASLTKLMTADLVLSSVPTSTKVTITQENLLNSDAGDWGFRSGDTYSVGDLIKIGLVASSNDAMAAAAGSLSGDPVTQMNAAAGSLGLSQTYFLNPTGLDISADVSGGYGSAYDIARLAALFYAHYPRYFELTEKPQVSIGKGSMQLAAAATAVPLQTIPGFVGAKTGYTDLAGGNLVAVFDIEVGHPLVAVVLGSTEKGRFTDITTLITAERDATSP